MPLSSSTPAARPSSTRIRSTGAPVRIVAPASRAASAIASVSRPIPPRTKPHCRIPPPACSEAWSCRSTNAVPGVDGPPVRVVDRVPAERRAHLVAREVLGQVLGRRGAEQEQRVGDPAAVARRARAEPGQHGELAADAGARGSGGVVSISGVISSAIRPSSSSNSGSARASAAEKRRELAPASPARSSSRCRCEPSANRFSAGPAASTSIPRSTSRRSRQTGSRSMLST